MGNNIKDFVRQSIISHFDVIDGEKEETVCVLYAQRFANCTKETYFYLSNLMNDEEEFFEMQHNVNYDNEESLEKSCWINAEETFAAFGFSNYEEFKNYLVEKYNDDPMAWYNIIKEMESKGVYPQIDESVSDGNILTNM